MVQLLRVRSRDLLRDVVPCPVLVADKGKELPLGEAERGAVVALSGDHVIGVIAACLQVDRADIRLDRKAVVAADHVVKIAGRRRNFKVARHHGAKLRIRLHLRGRDRAEIHVKFIAAPIGDLHFNDRLLDRHAIGPCCIHHSGCCGCGCNGENGVSVGIRFAVRKGVLIKHIRAAGGAASAL